MINNIITSSPYDEVYAECVNAWRCLHLGLFYAKIPTICDKKLLQNLMQQFEFPGCDDVSNESYHLDKGQLDPLLFSDNTEIGD